MKEKIIVVFESLGKENKLDGFAKTWIREFPRIKDAKKEIRSMEKYKWKVGRIYEGRKINKKDLQL